MDGRRRAAAALGGAGAAMAGSGALLTRQNSDWGDFAYGFVFGLALILLVAAAFRIRRGGAPRPRG